MDISNVGFDCDDGNWLKCAKHGVSREEIEACFHHEMIVSSDPRHVETEQRFNAVGENDEGRKIFLVFTFRRTQGGNLTRPISVRYMHKKEIEHYAQQKT